MAHTNSIFFQNGGKKRKKKEKQTTFVKISCLTIIDLAA